VYDAVAEYGFSARAAAKTRYVGYLRREPNGRSAELVRDDLQLESDQLVLVTAGGGGDGHDLFSALLDGLRARVGKPSFDCVLVHGPLMPRAQRERLRSAAAARPSVRCVGFTEDLPSYIAAADVVVSMGGYNSICEILSFARPALIVPRVTPRKEQLIRARALEQRGLVRTIHPADLTPRRLLREVELLLEQPTNGGRLPALEGLPGAAHHLDALLFRRTAA